VHILRSVPGAVEASSRSQGLDVRPVLVTGGAGFLGINLCRFLMARGHRVRSLDIAPFDYPERSTVDAIEGDVRDSGAVERAMEGVELIVHAAAALPLSTPAEIRSTNVDGTRLLLHKALARKVARFVFISSTAVYGVPDHHPVREEDALQGVGPYGESKVAGEGLCTGARMRGLCLPILRPKSFVGPERLGVFELLYDFAFEGHAFPVLGTGSNRYQLLDVEDLCQAIYLCLTLEPERVNDTFNVGAHEFGTMRDSFQAVLDRAGHGRRIVGIPATPAIAVLKLLERAHLSPIYRWIYDTAARASYVSTERIETRLGFVPRYSNRAALARNYDWYVAHRGEYHGKTGVSHRVPWNEGALRLAKLFL
jgi:nucleoside-diphosphate-sugar epimerase